MFKLNILKSLGLSIIIGTNLIETNFLDVSFNVHTGKYVPFKKPNNTPLYIHKKIPPPTVNYQGISINDQQLSLIKLRLRTKQPLKTMDTKQH